VKDFGKQQEPGIKGGLIGVFLYLVAILLLYSGLLAYSLIGTTDQPGYLRAQLHGFDYGSLSASEMAFLVLDISVSVLQIAAIANLLRLMFGHKKNFVTGYFWLIVFITLLQGVYFLVYNLVYGEIPRNSAGGTGIVVMLGVYQYLRNSKRAEITFVK
jgi:hypothetical protein